MQRSTYIRVKRALSTHIFQESFLLIIFSTSRLTNCGALCRAKVNYIRLTSLLHAEGPRKSTCYVLDGTTASKLLGLAHLLAELSFLYLLCGIFRIEMSFYEYIVFGLYSFTACE